MTGRLLGWVRLAGMALATFACAVPAIVVAAFDRGGPRSSAIVALWARTVVRCAGVRVRVEGAPLPAEGAVVYVSTHESMLDIPVLFTVVPARTRFIAKRELFRVPVFGQAIGLLGFVPVDRSDRRAAVGALAVAGELARADRPILVFPEGTRSPDGRLLPFKRGAFALAHDLRLPLVPIACRGGSERMRTGSTRVVPGEMVVRVGPVIDPDRDAADYASRETLMRRARADVERLVG